MLFDAGNQVGVFHKNINETAAYTATVGLLFTCIMVAEGALVIRVYAVYPPSHLSVLGNCAVYGPITLMKLSRIGGGFVLLKKAVASIGTPGGDTTFSSGLRNFLWTSSFAKTGWILRTVDITLSIAPQSVNP